MVHRIRTGGVRACVLVSYGRSKHQSDETAGRGIVNEKRSMRCAAGFAKLYKLYTGDNLNLYAKKSVRFNPKGTLKVNGFLREAITISRLGNTDGN